MTRRLKILALLTLAGGLAAPKAANAGSDAVAAIVQVLDDQVAAWNRGDVEAFMRGYRDSPETTSIGKSIERGYLPILQRYKKNYATKDAMGRLDFSELRVRELGTGYAVATGKFHLSRTSAGGGASGIFSLVWEKTPEGWKIILDHTSSTPP